jgi:hypothetical protein
MFGCDAATDRSHASHAIMAFQKMSQCREGGEELAEKADSSDVKDQSNAVPEQIDATPGEDEEH